MGKEEAAFTSRLLAAVAAHSLAVIPPVSCDTGHTSDMQTMLKPWKLVCTYGLYKSLCVCVCVCKYVNIGNTYISKYISKTTELLDWSELWQ